MPNETGLPSPSITPDRTAAAGAVAECPGCGAITHLTECTRCFRDLCADCMPFKRLHYWHLDLLDMGEGQP